MTEASVSNIVVREANANDFEWVADLMVRALTPFYDGDHRAHARRIFDAHIAGGIDRVGQFSSGQHMFIAESGDGQPAGVIHVVNKKQGTVKISPLIVDTAYRGKMGVGSVLLKHAEDFARSLGSRQIYCTVAAPNKKALGFFLKKGFRVTGTAKDHYKVGIDEHMLYKQLVDEAGFDSPNISVVPFDESQADSARALILSQMSDAFNGVDNDWVDALFAGYRRRELGDVNAKFKIIFTAECDGKVVGVAGATPKKGRPIKLMPLVASSEAAFEALVVDLQGLLEDYGHKLYVHLVPEPWQVACLQRHGWSLEGVFPGGYAPNSVVQHGDSTSTRKEQVCVRCASRSPISTPSWRVVRLSKFASATTVSSALRREGCCSSRLDIRLAWCGSERFASTTTSQTCWRQNRGARLYRRLGTQRKRFTSSARSIPPVRSASAFTSSRSRSRTMIRSAHLLDWRNPSE